MTTGWMSEVEALMWRVGRDPFLDPTFGSLTLLDSAPDTAHLRQRLQRMVQRNPRFGQRVVEPAGQLTVPMWCDDPDFDIDGHLRTIRLPRPGNRRQLYDTAVRLVQEPFDESRSPWEFVVVEGLDDGGGALVQRIHHAVTDGEGGLRAAEEILDLTPSLPVLDESFASAGVASGLPNPIGLVSSIADRALRRAGRAGHSAWSEVANLATHPWDLPDSIGTGVGTARSMIDQFTSVDLACSPLWANRTLRRRLDTVDVPLASLQATAHALDGSVNDAFVTALTGAIGALHREADLPTPALRMAMPVSTRGRGVSGGNAFVPARLVVPIDEPDPVRRFHALHDVLEPAKHEPAFGVVDQMAMVANWLPTPLVTRIIRDQARAVDFAASNVRGAGVPLWLAGARVIADYPLGPLTATALNVTLLSYNGVCHMGVHSDAGAVSDPERLIVLMEEAFAELFEAVT